MTKNEMQNNSGMDRAIPTSERRRRMWRRGLISGVAVLAVTLAVIIIISMSGKSVKRGQLTFSTVDVGDVENTVSATGKVVPAFEEVVVSPVSSRILEVFHHEGDLVESGEPLLRLDTHAAESEVRRLADELSVSRNTTVEAGLENRTQLTNLEMQIEAKRMYVEELKAELINERRLDSIGSGTGDRVRQAELAWRTGVLELEQLRKQLANESTSRAARLESNRLQENIRGRTLEEARRILADAGIKAPRRATLTYINNNIGGSVAAGEKLAVLSDLASFRISGEIPEGDGDKLGAGGMVNIKLGKRRLRGRIGSVTPRASDGMIGFSVMPDTGADSLIRPGMRVDLNLICGLKEGVLRIANGAYFHGPGVYTLYVADPEDKNIELRKVRLGDSNFDYVEVIDGLKAGEKVVVNDMSEYKTNKILKLKD